MFQAVYLEAGETELTNYEIRSVSPSSRWNRTQKLWNTCVAPFAAIDDLRQKCLEATPTPKYEPLNCPITVLSVWILNTFSRNKRRQNCEKPRWRSQSALVWPLAMSCLDAKISVVPKHQLIVPSTLLAPATHIRTDKVTKWQRHIRPDHWHMSYVFKITLPQGAQNHNSLLKAKL